MNHRIILVVLVLLCQEGSLWAQYAIHTDTLTVRKVSIHHSVSTGNGRALVPTGETMDLYEWETKQGTNVIYRPDGTKYLEGYYHQKNDSTLVADGYFTIFNSDSSISKQGKYKLGKLTGDWLHYDSVGNLDFVINHNRKQKRIYHLSGEAKAEGKYKVLRPSGREVRIGKWRFYHLNGALHCEGRLSLFGKVGKWFCYNDQGEVIHSKCYSRQLFRFHKSINIKSNYGDVCSCND